MGAIKQQQDMVFTPKEVRLMPSLALGWFTICFLTHVYLLSADWFLCQGPTDHNCPELFVAHWRQPLRMHHGELHTLLLEDIKRLSKNNSASAAVYTQLLPLLTKQNKCCRVTLASSNQTENARFPCGWPWPYGSDENVQSRHQSGWL